MRDVILRLITALVAKGIVSLEELHAVEEFVELEFQESYQPAGRLVSHRKIKCKDNESKPCEVITSIRGGEISIRVEGGDQWAHITKQQAMHLGKWLIEASNRLRITRT